MMKTWLLMMALILSIGMVACQEDVDPNHIKTIDLTFDEETLDVTTDTEGIILQTKDIGDHIEVTVDVTDPFYVDQRVNVLINDVKLDQTKVTVEDNHIIILIPHPRPVDPESYVDVDVTFDPHGGVWGPDIFETMTPAHELTITALNDLTGTTLSLFDKAQTQLRWFYKIFLAYDEDIEAYKVVYFDASTASILYLDLPDYDWVIGAHLHTEDTVAKDVMIALTSTPQFPLYIRMDQDPTTYTSGELHLDMWTHDQLMGEVEKTYRNIDMLPSVYKDEFSFLGWSDGTSIYHTFPRYQAKEGIKNVRYEAVWGSKSMNDLITYLTPFIPETTMVDLVLPTSYSAFQLSWESSAPEVISSEGVYRKPYQTTIVTLSATVTSPDGSEVITFDVIVEGYKSLEGPIASSYIYRNFHLVNDTFFQSLDIINGAFITAQSDGSLTGSAFLSNMTTYIMPQARLYGNWVIPSVAPDSAWSTIASSSVLMNRFADNIVTLINTYGFDGIDIDWETPTTSESTRYTELMRIVYTKVKANNPNHLVTTAITGGQWQPEKYDLLNSAPYIDYINMMTYGMVSTGAQYQNALYRASMYHNTTFNVGKTLTSCSIDESIDIFHDIYQIPYNKIIVGVAFYGIRQTRTSLTTAFVNAGSVHYTDIVNTYVNNDNYIRAYDERAGVPYLVRKDGLEFISYDNRRSILEKSAYVIEHELAGIMYWEHGLDATGQLLDAIYEGLKS